MASASEPTDGAQMADDLTVGLWRLAVLPDWLKAALQADEVASELRHSVPEFASGELTLRGCKVRRLVLNGSSRRWVGDYTITVVEPRSGQHRVVVLRGTLTAPRMAQPGRVEPQATSSAFGSPGWRWELPALGLVLETQPPDTALPALPQLTDPEQARALLEQSIGAGMPAYRDLQIQRCTPEVLSYKPGSRCTIRYHLEYSPDLTAGRNWPGTVIAKTYRKDSKARNAYEGMLALWHSPLAAGDVVTIAEPLAYVSELKLLVQRSIPEERTLEDLLRSALRAGTPEALDELYTCVRQAAAGLVALHHSGACHGETIVLEDQWEEIRELVERLAVPVPELAGVVAPLLARLEAFAAAHPAGPPVPTHGTFGPEQVLIHRGTIGFIDFDDFCMAEPALDVGRFCAAIKDTGMSLGDERFFAHREARLARLAQLDAICEVFIAHYAAGAPIARERVALWQARDLLRDSLHYWIKAKPAEPDTPMLTLEQLLRSMGLHGN